MYCSQCGKQIDDDAKFCKFCGAPIDSHVKQQSHSTDKIRQEEYAGTILKCPHCGAAISATDVRCPTCGYQLYNRTAPKSLAELQERIYEIEKKRTGQNDRTKISQTNLKPKGPFGWFAETMRTTEEYTLKLVSISDVAREEISVIQAFPIPNTVDEIIEFMVMAEGNINVALSKNTAYNRLQHSPGQTKSDEMFISDAWVSKFRQAYHKAELLMSDDPRFEKIQKMYRTKMKQLKFKEDD